MAKANMDQLLSEGVLVQLEISVWPGQKFLSPEDLGLSEDEVDDRLYSLGRKRLVEKERLRVFRNLESEARRVLDDHSFEFPVGKARFVPLSALHQVIEKLEPLKIDFKEEVDRIVGEYEELREKMRALYSEALPGIHKRLGSSEPFEKFATRFLEKIDEAYPLSVRDRFGLRYSMFRLQVPDDAEFDAIEKSAVQELDETRRAIIAEKSAEIRSEINSQMDEFLVDVVGALRTEIAEVCGRTAELIAQDKPLKENSLNALRKLIGRFRDLNFMGDHEIDRQIAEVKTLLNGKMSADFRDNNALLQELKGKLNQASKAATRIVDLSEIAESFGAGRRLMRKEG